MPLDLPADDAAFAMASVWTARAEPGPDAWDHGPVLTVELEGQPYAVAWSDELEAEERLPPGHVLFVHSVGATLGQLPPGRGLVVDPHAATARTVRPEDRDGLQLLGRLWAPMVDITLHPLADEDVDGLITALRERLARWDQLGRVRVLGYQVAGGAPLLLVVVEQYLVDGLALVVDAMTELGDPLARFEIDAVGYVPEPWRSRVLAVPPIDGLP